MNNQISPGSYIKIDKNVPQFELLNFFLSKSTVPVQNFIKSNLYHTNKPVFTITQKVGQPNNFEFEFVFYKFDPHREYINNITLSNTFISKNELERIDPNITKSKLYDFGDFVACYAKINEETVSRGSNSVKFLYMAHGKQDTQFPLFIAEDDLKGEIKHTDKFAKLTTIVEPSKFNLYYLDDIITDEEMLFFATKPLSKTEAIIIEDLSFNNFLKFLDLFMYSKDFVDFCKSNYNDSYIFCVSYEINVLRQIVSSTIYGLLA